MQLPGYTRKEKPIVLIHTVASNKFCHFKILLDCHKLKKNPGLIMPMPTKCKKNEKKMTMNITEHDDRLGYLRRFYNGAFASKNDIED
jgi:hypothetical protein